MNETGKTTPAPRGFWWRTMGYTRLHMTGVFATEALLGVIGVSGMVAAPFCEWQLAVCLLLAAACVFLIQIGVLLASLLSLLFYVGAPHVARGMGEEHP